MEEEGQQQDRGGVQEREKEAAAAAGEGQERRVPDHLPRRGHVHEVGAAEDGVLPAEAEREHRQVADQRAGNGVAFRHLQRERAGAVHVVPLIGKHSEVQGVPDEAPRSQRRRQALHFHG